MPAAVGLLHYNLRAARELLDTLCHFYVEIVGLRVGARPPFASAGYWLYAGDTDVLHLSEVSPGETRAAGVATTFDHVAFRCQDRAGYEQRLADAGVTYGVSTVPGLAQVQLFFRDPAGNGVELNFLSEPT